MSAGQRPLLTSAAPSGRRWQILVAYFLVIIIVIPVVVGLWWRNSSKFLEDGVMQNTAYRFYRQVQENTATKYLPGVLASACELVEGAPCNNVTADDLAKLYRRVSQHFVKNQGDLNNDIMKIKTLVYAHLLGEEIPPALKKDMDYVLKHSHHLLNGLLNITMEQRCAALPPRYRRAAAALPPAFTRCHAVLPHRARCRTCLSPRLTLPQLTAPAALAAW